MRFYCFLVALALVPAAPSAAAGSLSGMTFVVDAGHGTRYPDGSPLNVGAVGPDGVQEAKVTLAVAEDLAGLLRTGGARVALTRSYAHPYRVATNLRKDNRARAALANAMRATAFISIHADSSLDPRKRGISVFWLHPNSARLARNVRAALAPLALALSDLLPLDRDRFHSLVERVGRQKRHRQRQHGCRPCSSSSASFPIRGRSGCSQPLPLRVAKR